MIVEAELPFTTFGGDFGRVRAALYETERSEDGAVQSMAMIPQQGYDLGEPEEPPEESSVSARWHLDNVPGYGNSYRVRLWAVALDGDGDSRALVEGSGGSARAFIKTAKSNST